METSIRQIRTISATSRQLGVHSRTIRRWADEGLLPIVDVGGRPYIRQADIDRLVFPDYLKPSTFEKEEQTAKR